MATALHPSCGARSYLAVAHVLCAQPSRSTLPNNPVLAAKYIHLTTCYHNRLARQQARTACAAALLRWLHVVAIQRVTWDPVIAAGGRPLNLTA